MYLIFLEFHSWLRWGVVFFLILLVAKFSLSFYQKNPYSKADRILSSLLLGFVHLQFVSGCILYFSLSPFVQLGKTPLRVLMKDKVLRYWNIEHLVMMFIFVCFIQLGFSLSKRASERKKHKTMLGFCILALLTLVLAMPWPWESYGRKLF